jgi:hypothetical protein
LEPWIALWQFTQPRAMKRVLTDVLNEPGALPKQALFLGSFVAAGVHWNAAAPP